MFVLIECVDQSVSKPETFVDFRNAQLKMAKQISETLGIAYKIIEAIVMNLETDDSEIEIVNGPTISSTFAYGDKNGDPCNWWIYKLSEPVDGIINI